MKNILWIFYFIIILYLPVEKLFHLYTTFMVSDLVAFIAYLGFLLIGLVCVFQPMSIKKSILGILMSVLFSIQLGILNMVYFFGEELWFCGISFALSLLLASPLLVKCTFFAIKEIKSPKHPP